MNLNFRDIDDLLLIKPKGVFEIQTGGGETTITIHRFGQPAEYITCISPGHANRIRQELTDQGMTGLVGDAH